MSEHTICNFVKKMGSTLEHFEKCLMEEHWACFHDVHTWPALSASTDCPREMLYDMKWLVRMAAEMHRLMASLQFMMSDAQAEDYQFWKHLFDRNMTAFKERYSAKQYRAAVRDIRRQIIDTLSFFL